MIKNKSNQLGTNDSFGIFSLKDDTQQQKRSSCHQSDMDQSESWVVPKIKYRQSHHSSHFRIIVCGDSGMILDNSFYVSNSCLHCTFQALARHLLYKHSQIQQPHQQKRREL